MFGNRMQPSAIPERVYALCREVVSRPIEETKLKALLEPQNLGGKQEYFGNVRAAAEEIGLISTKENVISLAVDKNEVKTMENMRRYINLQMEQVSDSLFYKVTRQYFDMDAEVLKHTSVSKMSDLMGKSIGEKVIEEDMRAWRFWTAFLGFGYMHEPTSAAGILLPNAATFLNDVIKDRKFKKNTTFAINEFVSEIQPSANIVLNNAVDTKKFNMGFSNALRMLLDLGVIKAEHRSDALEIWALYPCEGHDLDTTITHVTIGG